MQTVQTDLDRERKTMLQLRQTRTLNPGIYRATVGVDSDIQGTTGTTLPEREGLEVQLLDAPNAEF